MWFTPYMCFFHVIKIDGSIFSGYTVEHMMTSYVFVWHASKVVHLYDHCYEFQVTVVVHVFIVTVDHTFVHKYSLLSSLTVPSWVSLIILQC